MSATASAARRSTRARESFAHSSLERGGQSRTDIDTSLPARSIASLQSVDSRSPEVVVVSTHLDDAVLSCWSVLDSGEDVLVVNVFTGGPPPGYLTEWDRDTAAKDSASRMAQRRDEDRAALAVAGRSSVNLELVEQDYGDGHVSAAVLQPHLAAPVVYAPAGIGLKHVNQEHVRVRDAVLEVRPDACLYADQPYCLFRPEAELPAGLRGGLEVHHVSLSVAQRERKARAIHCYLGELPKLEAIFGRFGAAEFLEHETLWLPRWCSAPRTDRRRSWSNRLEHQCLMPVDVSVAERMAVSLGSRKVGRSARSQWCSTS